MWFGFLIALFIGGFIGVKIGQIYELPTAISMLFGAIIGGISWKPREIAKALWQAIKESTHFLNSIDYGKIGVGAIALAKEIWFAILYVTNFILAVVGWVVGALFSYSLIYHQDSSKLDGEKVMLLGALWVLLALVFFVLPVPEKLNPKTQLWRFFDNAEKIHNHIRIGIPGIVAFVVAVLTPLLLLWGGVITSVSLAWFLLIKTPAITLRFIDLVATEPRLTVMSSCAIGVFWGSFYGSPLIGGFSSMAVGAFASIASRHFIKTRRLV